MSKLGNILYITKKEFSNKKLMVAFIMVNLLFLFFMYGVLRDIYGAKKSVDVFDDYSSSELSDIISNGDVYTQRFTTDQIAICGIQARFATYNQTSHGNVDVELLSGKDVICKNTFSQGIIGDGTYTSFNFGEKVLEANKITAVRFTFYDMPDGNALAMYLNELEGEKTTNKDGEALLGSIQLKVLIDRNDSFLAFAIICFGMLYIAIIGAFFMLFVFKKEIEKSYVLIMAVIGAMFIVLMPIYTAPDEPFHFGCAYKLSNKMLFHGNNEKCIMMRKSDYDFHKFLRPMGLNREYYSDYVGCMSGKADEKQLVETDIQYNGDLVYYIPSALGIAIGRILAMGPLMTFSMGVLFNVIFFVLASYYAIKSMPYGKIAMMSVLLLPMSVHQIASYSYDSGIFALIAIIIALTAKYINDAKSMNRADYIILGISCAIIFFSKQGAMIPVAILPLIFIIADAFKRKKNKEQLFGKLEKMFTIFMTFIAVLFVIKMVYNKIINMLHPEKAVVSAYAVNGPFYTVGYLLTNIKELISLLFHTLFVQGDFYLQTFLGGSLGWFEIGVNWHVIVAFLIVMILAFMANGSSECVINTKSRLVFLIVAILIAGFSVAGMLVAWTPITSSYIQGVQGRYFIPSAIIAIFAVACKNVTFKKSIDRKLLFTLALLYVPTITYMFLRISAI